MVEEVKKYIDRGMWRVYNKNEDGITHAKRFDGFETWYKYDEKGRIIYRKNSRGEEYWWRYNKEGNISLINKEKYDELEYLNRKKNSRFEIMDI